MMDVDAFVAFLKERHAIYTRRARGNPPPWTTDAVLANYRFCNVYRELDTVTIWVRENIREQFPDSDKLWWMLAVAREINWPDTLQALMDAKCWPELGAWSPAKAIKIMEARAAKGDKVFTGAYIINPGGGYLRNGTTKPANKIEYAVLDVLSPMLKKSPPAWGSMEEAHAWIRQFRGMGGFMAYEVVSDMRWTRYGAEWRDIMTWAFAGPGAIRGLNRLSGAPTNRGMPEKVSLGMMAELRTQVAKRWDKKLPTIEMREIEHGLCEYDKWVRATKGEGKLRSGYKPTAS